MQSRVLAGRYRLQEAIGRGGMATVYRGVDDRLGRPVAIKVLDAELASSIEARGQFDREARLAARLSHPHIAQIFDYGVQDGWPYIVMEYVDGPSLKEGAPLPVPEALRVGAQIADALEAIHSQGLVHADVKPQNIVRATTGAKLVDFGVVHTHGQAAGHLVAGTPHYLAPERVAGAVPTAQADIYALGVTLYEALTGLTPYQGEDPSSIAQHVLQGRVPPPSSLRPGISNSVDAIVLRATAPDPASRYLRAAEMAADLQRAVAAAGQTTVVQTAGRPRAWTPPPAPPAIPETAKSGRDEVQRWVLPVLMAGVIVALLLSMCAVLSGGGLLRGLFGRATPTLTATGTTTNTATVTLTSTPDATDTQVPTAMPPPSDTAQPVPTDTAVPTATPAPPTPTVSIATLTPLSPPSLPTGTAAPPSE